MRITDNTIYPYPIVGHAADGLDSIGVDAWVERSDKPDSGKITYEITFRVEDDYILDLIKSGYAKYACEFDCKSTQHRELKSSESPEFNINLDPTRVATSIDFLLIVVAVKDIVDYQNPNVNPVYKGCKYHIHRGEVLAFCNKYTEALDKGRNDRMNIMRFRKTKDSYITHDISGDYIIIKLPEKIFENRKALGIDPLLASVAVPALNFALENMKGADNDGKLWAEALRQQIMADSDLAKYLDDDNNIDDPASTYVIAQALLSNPHLKFFEHPIDEDYEPDND